MVKCICCGRELRDDQRYCDYCGTRAVHVPPIFTMARTGTDIATGVIRDYSEWGFYNRPDASATLWSKQKIDPEMNAMDALPGEADLLLPDDPPVFDHAAEELVEEQFQQEQEEEETDPEKPVRKRKIMLTLPALVALIVLLLGLIAGCTYMIVSSDETYSVDLDKLMAEPKLVGYNESGEIAFMPQMDDAKRDEWLQTVDYKHDRDAFRKVLDTVKYTPDKTKKLSNGDIVTITIDYDKKMAREADLKVRAKTVTYEVKDLEIGEDLAYDPNAYHAYYDDFILPESDRVKLSKEDIAYSTEGSISATQQAINEIYARHGYIFGNSHYDELFRGFKWYVPKYQPDEFKNKWLNEYEKANLSLLIEYRDELEEIAAEAEKKKQEEEKAKAEAEKQAATKATTKNSSDEDD